MRCLKIGVICVSVSAAIAGCTTKTFFPNHSAVIAERASKKPLPPAGVEAGAFEVMKIRVKRALRHECRRAAVAEGRATIVAWRRFRRAAEATDQLADDMPYRFETSRSLPDEYWCVSIDV
jgi:hypothetical protein